MFIFIKFSNPSSLNENLWSEMKNQEKIFFDCIRLHGLSMNFIGVMLLVKCDGERWNVYLR